MQKMKDSGIEWIGQIPEDWGLSKIGAIYEERNIKVSDQNYPPLSVTKQGVVPQLETAAKTDNGDNRKLIKKNDFVINSRSDRRGSCGISEYDGSCSLINTVLKPRHNMHNRYYNYVFRSELFADEFYRWGNGIVDDLWSTKWSNMKRIYVPFPNIEIQCRIADYLDEKCGKIDRYIEKQQQVIEKLKSYKQSVITEAVTKGLNPDVPMKDSGIEWIGRIPKNWGVAKLANLFTFLGGYAFNSDLYVSETENLIVRIGNVKNDRLLFDANPVYISDNLAEQVIKFKLQCGDILFTMTGTKGKRDYFYTLILDDSHIQTKNLYLNQRVGCFRKKAHIHAEYYNYLLKDNRILDSIFLYETGTANQGNLGIDSINRTKVHLPPYEEQVMIAKYLKDKCSRIDAVIAKKEEAINKSTEYKKSLIYEAVTGKLEV